MTGFSSDNESETSGANATHPAAREIEPGGCSCGGCTCQESTSYIYALGQIQTRFPTAAIEKEFAQVIGRADNAGLTDWQMAYQVLSKRENRYLARKLCWVMTIERLETYLLTPHDPADIELLINLLRDGPSPIDLDLVIGVRGPIAPPEMCNGLQVPIVRFDQLYSFNIDALMKAIPRPDSIPEEKFGAASEELFYRIMQLADNAGATDEHRALNYLAVRYPAIYASVAEAHARGESLSSVEVRPSRLQGVRKVVDAIFAFTSRTTDVTTKMFVRVDVTEAFPFLVTKMSPYYDR